MTLDDYVAWVSRHADGREDHALLEVGLAFAGKIGDVAETLARWLHGDESRPDQVADALGDVAHCWARLCVVTGIAPSALLARSRAHLAWRRAGRPPRGPSPALAPTTLEEFTSWAAGASDTGTGRPGDRTLWDVGIALVGDAGEVVECLRKLTRGDDQQRARLAGELGDVWHYWTRLAIATGIAPAEILERNRARNEKAHRLDAERR